MLIELLLGTGVRIGSALALDVQDVDFAHGELLLRTTKNDRPTTAVMPAGVAGQLREYLAGRTDGPAFQVNGRRLAARHAQRRLSGWLTKAGIQGHSAHSFRHTFAADLLARTGDLRLVQAALNHASIVSTTIYTSVDRARLRAVVGG
jgi:integrase/recombinase XerD